MSNLVDNDDASSAPRGQDVRQELTRQPRRRFPVAVLALVAAIAIGSMLGSAFLYWPAAHRGGAPLVETSDMQPRPDAVGFSVTPGSVRAYKAVDRPCTAVWWAPIAAEVGGLGDDPQESSTVSSSVVTMRCSVALGDGADHGVAMAEIMIFDNSSAEGVYENLQRVHSEDVTLTPISALGAAAYAYIENRDGPAVATYDGNLYMRLVWISLKRQMPPVDGDIARSLVEVARQTMAHLRA
ncbi:hypothetical protein I0C86_27730 [Plantactinospora sp. S1510]|uniref:Uncharacterized protein n=1 Tax=Plantactinospora alkalitolerans TaxID=2789879 RepID=A0ABS0H3M2_9ACTN|nr:hypothetical protein [Plantactinospora alkalitolerans]MBF9132717.1 hypothetical protein [Plantactinospora alkalitolerans]